MKKITKVLIAFLVTCCMWQVEAQTSPDYGGTCPTDIIANNDPGNCSATVTWTEPTAIDPDDGFPVMVIQTGGSPPGSVFAVGGPYIIEYTAFDNGADPPSICTFTVTVEDNEDPIITCIADDARDTNAGLCQYTVAGTEFDATFTDNCPDGNITNDLNGLASIAGEVLPKGVTTVIWTADDGNGQTATCTTVITVEDNEDPVITCAADGTRDTDPGVCDYTVVGVEFDATFTDNCPDGNITNDLNASASIAGVTLPKGVTTVIWTADDGNGQTATCTTVITVEDNEAPGITCVPFGLRDTDPGVCQYTVVGTEFDATFTDNCMDGSISNDLNGLATLAGEVLPKGVTTVVWTVVDGNGQTATCNTIILIEDNENPVITCIADDTRDTDPGLCQYTVVGTEFDATFTDNCMDGSITNDLNGLATIAGEVLAIGDTTVVWTVDDGNGEMATCTTVITVEDNEDPMITCIADDARDTNAGLCQYTVVGTEFDATFTDNCMSGSISNDLNGLASIAGEVLPKGVTTVIWTADDGNGQTATCTTVITVEDNEDPGITCVPFGLRDTDPGVCEYTVVGTEFDATFTDNCMDGSISNDLNGLASIAGETLPKGVTTVVWTVVDGNGQTATCNTIILIEDNENPVITCIADDTRDTDPGLCQYTVVGTEFDATFTDNCTDGSITNDLNGLATIAGEVLAIGDTTVVWTVDDGNGEMATCTTVITVEDNEDPMITCIADDARDTNAGLCQYTVVGNEFDATFTDNCMSGSISNDLNGLASIAGEVLPKGVTTVIWTADDGNGQTATCTTVITVEDNEDPVITCAADGTRDTDPGVCDYTVVGVEFDATFTDNCPDGNITNDLNGLVSIAGEVLPKGVTTVIWTSDDGNGQTATCTTVITVEDNEDPVITCAADGTRDTDPGVCDYTVVGVEFDATFTDNCPDGNITNDLNGLASIAGEVLPKGVTTVIWTADDGNGQTATCTTVITVEDNEDPVITCAADGTRDTDPGVCDYTVVGVEFDATFTDNCPDGNITNDLNGLASIAGEVLPKGVTTVIWTADDGNGQTATCTTVITVEDNEDPVITCAADGTRDTDPSVCDYTVVGVEFDATFTDNCPDGNITNDLNGLASIAGEVLPKGVTTVIWTADDGNGQTATCTTVITVEDNEDPVITCAADGTRDTDPGVCDYTVVGVEFDATFTDNCPDGNITNDLNGLASIAGEVLPKGVTTVIWTADDGNGQTATCTTVITVEDNEDPVITCAADGTRDTDPGVCDYTVVGVEFDATFTDNCPDGNITNDLNGLASIAGEVLPKGVTTVIWTADDGNGQTATCTTVITVEDNEDPVITCAADGTRDTDPGVCDYTVVGVEFDATFTDNCPDGNITNDLNGLASIAGEVLPKGVTTVIWTADDGNGQIVACTTVITVEDNEDPVITCAADGTRDTDPGVCDYTVVGVEFDATFTDNCPDGNITNDLNGLASIAGEVLPKGVTTVIWTADDGNGQIVTCTTVITVEDNEDPVITCAADGTRDTDPGVCDYTVVGVEFDATFTDNCPDGNITNDLNGLASIAGEVLPKGVTTVIWTADDGNGQTATCITVITVEDNEDPVITCAADGTRDTDPGVCDYTVVGVEFDATFTDNCPDGNITNDLNGLASIAGEVLPKGVTTVVWTVDDGNGQTATCTTVITVEDNEDPVITCIADDSRDTEPGLCQYTIVGTEFDATFTDNCPDGSITNDMNGTDTIAGEILVPGVYSVIWTADDGNGQTATCTTVITVEDNEDPIIACPADTAVNTDPGQCSTVVVFPDALALDNCGVASVVQTAGLPSGSMFPVGINTVEYTATDVHGNTAVCSFTITVTDNEPAMAICQDITIQLDANGDAMIVAADVDGGSTDNCGVASISIDIDTFDCSDVGPNNVTLTVTDVNGNVSSCIAVVTVEDVTPPVAVCMDITVQLDATGTVTIAGIDVDGGSTDACGIASYDLDIDTFDCSNVGPNTVVLTVTDVNGNVSTCTAVVTVEDVTDPVLVCMDITLELGADGTASITPADVILSLDDACGINTTAIDISDFDCSDIGTPVTVTVFAIDNNGNTALCMAVVTVVDLLAPVVTCPADVTVDPGPGNLFYEVPDYFALGEATAEDNCTDPLILLSQSPAVGTLLPDGVYPVTMTAEDEYGNIGTCTFTLTVESVLGVGDNDLSIATIVMYPNPAKDVVMLSNPQSIALEQASIYDLTGRLIQTIDLTNMGSEKVIDVSELAAATYVVVIQSENGQITKQLLKE